MLATLTIERSDVMRMYFRTFTGYMGKDEIPLPVLSGSVGRYYSEKLGTQIVHAPAEGHGLFCRTNQSCCLSEQTDRGIVLGEAIKFMEDYPDIGCFTYSSDGKSKFSEINFSTVDWPDPADGGERVYSVLTEKCFFNAYRGMVDCYVLFNVEPRLGAGSGRGGRVVFGKDVYSLKYEQKSIIIWNLEALEGILSEEYADYTFWGIAQNTDTRLSQTDDVLVGLKGGKRIYAPH